MKINHKINHGWAPNRNDPEWERRVEREAQITTDAAEAAYRRAQARLARAESRLAKVEAMTRVPRATVARLEALVELRRQELLDIERLMTSHGSPSTSRGRKSHRGVPSTHPL